MAEVAYIFLATILSMIQLFITTSLGAVLTKYGMMTSETNTDISKALAKVMLPLFTFASIASNISIEDIQVFGVLILNLVINCILTSVFAGIHTLIFKPNKSFRFTVFSTVVFNNAVNVPLLILKGACASYGPLADEPDCSKADSYVFIQSIPFNILVWSYGYGLIMIDQKHALKDRDLSESNIPKPNSAKTILRKFVDPIPLASYLGIIVGLIPGIKPILSDKDAPLRPFIDSFLIIGLAAVVFSQAILGSNLVHKYKIKSKISAAGIGVVVFIRLILVGLAGLGVIYMYLEVGLVENKPTLLYTMYLIYISPPAVALAIICQIADVAVNELTKIMFWMYVASIITMTGFSLLFFTLFM